MYKEHPVFKTPDPSTVLWRYLDFTRFVSLLDQAALHFTQAGRLGDPFEGAFSVVNHQLRPQIYGDHIPAETWKNFGAHMKAQRQAVCISCWHESEYESAAMWKLYARERDGIAIKTTCEDLIESLRCDDDIFIGAVSYEDYNSTFIPEHNVFAPYVFKRREFSHEREVRAVSSLWNVDLTEEARGRSLTAGGVYLSVDVAVLIQEIRVAPYAEPWFVDLVGAVAKQYDLDRTVLPSSLADQPLW